MGNRPASESTHWYDSITGAPRYTIIGKNGKERNTTLTDAKKLGFVPSVTTVMSILDKPGLNDWRETQMMLAMMSVARRNGESDRGYMQRVREEKRKQGDRVRNRGTMLHGDIELAIQGRWHGHQEHVDKIARELEMAGLDLFGGRAEHSFAHPLGYGGKTDFWLGNAIVDFKSKDKIEPRKKLAWAEHAIQVGAYAHGVGIEQPRGFNCFVGVDDCEVVLHEWKPIELAHGLVIFKEMLTLWKLLKNWTQPIST